MRKIVLIVLISLTVSFNLRFLTNNNNQNTTVQGQIQDTKDKITGFQKVENLCNAADKIGKTWQNLVSAFKTTHQKQIKKMTDGKGFEYFHGSSEIFLAFGLRQVHYDKYWQRKADHLKIPKEMKQKFLEIADDSQFMDKQAWNNLDLAFNPEESKKDEVKGVTILINQPVDGKYDVMVTNIRAKFKLAPDLFIERTDTSVLGGIFEKGNEKIIKKPKTLTQDELTAILEMYKMGSFKILCEVFGINITPPSFN